MHREVEGNPEERSRFLNAYPPSVDAINDNHDHKFIMELLDRAIQKAESENL
jgi:hypothetical protein